MGQEEVEERMPVVRARSRRIALSVWLRAHQRDPPQTPFFITLHTPQSKCTFLRPVPVVERLIRKYVNQPLVAKRVDTE